MKDSWIVMIQIYLKNGTKPELSCLLFLTGRLGSKADRPSLPFGKAVWRMVIKRLGTLAWRKCRSRVIVSIGTFFPPFHTLEYISSKAFMNSTPHNIVSYYSIALKKSSTFSIWLLCSCQGRSLYFTSFLKHKLHPLNI